MRTPERLADLCTTLNPDRFPKWMIDTAHEIAIHLKAYAQQQGKTFSLLENEKEVCGILRERNSRQSKKIAELVDMIAKLDETVKQQDARVNKMNNSTRFRDAIIIERDKEVHMLQKTIKEQNDTIVSLKRACAINVKTIDDLKIDARMRARAK